MVNTWDYFKKIICSEWSTLSRYVGRDESCMKPYYKLNHTYDLRVGETTR